LYASADVVAFPATRPHQARPILEAGAMAKPVVASDFSNLREFVGDQQNGLLVPPGDANAIANALRAILTDQNLARRLGEENYRRTIAVHNEQINAPRFNAIYQQLLE
jgi:glycosyltransferase involved in cell wall biosynthesis